MHFLGERLSLLGKDLRAESIKALLSIPLAVALAAELVGGNSGLWLHRLTPPTLAREVSHPRAEQERFKREDVFINLDTSSFINEDVLCMKFGTT